MSRPGDLWVCGPHRVLCGNATVDDDVATLLGSETPAMCLTDPPFNVAIGKDSNPKHRQRRGLVNDDLPATDFAAFLERLAQLLAERVTGDVYCFMGASEWPALDGAMRAAGLHHSATIIWVKDNMQVASWPASFRPSSSTMPFSSTWRAQLATTAGPSTSAASIARKPLRAPTTLPHPDSSASSLA